MALKSYNLTLNGAAGGQNLKTVLSNTQTGGIDDVPLRAVILQPDGANANPIYIAGDNQVPTTANYGWRLEKATTGVPPAPFVIGEFDVGGPLRLSNFTVLGTNAEVLHIATIPY